MSPQPQPGAPCRRATAVNDVLARIGLSEAAREEWWEGRPYEVLGGRTPAQAWQAGDYETVEMIVEDWAYAIEQGFAPPGDAGPAASSGR